MPTDLLKQSNLLDLSRGEGEGGGGGEHLDFASVAHAGRTELLPHWALRWAQKRIRAEGSAWRGMPQSKAITSQASDHMVCKVNLEAEKTIFCYLLL